jgi:hypothetical protein
MSFFGTFSLFGVPFILLVVALLAMALHRFWAHASKTGSSTGQKGQATNERGGGVRSAILEKLDRQGANLAAKLAEEKLQRELLVQKLRQISEIEAEILRSVEDIESVAHSDTGIGATE